MATVRAANFDVETFGKTVALFDSNNAGEAENAFRKAVLMCARKGLRFCEAAGMAFGQGDGGEVADLQDQLQRQEAEHANQLTEAAEEIERLRAELAGGTPEGEHVIDLPGRLRRAWRFPQFRLLVLTLMIEAASAAHHQRHAGRVDWVRVPVPVRRVERGAVPQAWPRADVHEVGGLLRGPYARRTAAGQHGNGQQARCFPWRPGGGAGADALEVQPVAM